jgi:hypothetical protein
VASRLSVFTVSKHEVYLKCSFFSSVTQLKLIVIVNRRLWTTRRSHLQRCGLKSGVKINDKYYWAQVENPPGPEVDDNAD